MLDHDIGWYFLYFAYTCSYEFRATVYGIDCVILLLVQVQWWQVSYSHPLELITIYCWCRRPLGQIFYCLLHLRNLWHDKLFVKKAYFLKTEMKMDSGITNMLYRNSTIDRKMMQADQPTTKQHGSSYWIGMYVYLLTVIYITKFIQCKIQNMMILTQIPKKVFLFFFNY